MKKKERLYFINNDAVFYYFFRENLYLFKPLISELFKVNKEKIEEIVLINNKPYLDEVYNKYNVLYIQIKIFDKYVYLIVNNINNNRSIEYSENYMLNIELMEKYRKIYEQNKGKIQNVYFIDSKKDWIKRIMVWVDKKKIINTDFKYIYNVNHKNNQIFENIKDILDIISIKNEYDLENQGKNFKTKYFKIVNFIKHDVLIEAEILKEKRNGLILNSIRNNFNKKH